MSNSFVETGLFVETAGRPSLQYANHLAINKKKGSLEMEIVFNSMYSSARMLFANLRDLLSSLLR